MKPTLELMKKWENQAIKKTGAGVEKLVAELIMKPKKKDYC